MKKGQPYVIGIGELLWDKLPDGKKMGGAPANFIYHATQMGCEGEVISAVGDDSEGKELIAALNERNINSDLIGIESQYPTGTVTVSLDDSGDPSYIIHENVAWDNIRISEKIRNKVKQADAICFGTLAQRNGVSRNSILECLNSAGSECLKIFDINLRQQFYSKKIINKSLQLADVLKINQEELQIIAKLLKIKGKENEMLDTLAGTFRLKIIALTNGADSSILFFAGRISCIKTPVVDVADCIGAGDSFTAVLVSGLLKGLPIEEIHRKAVDLSAWVCTKAGATPDYNREIKKILNINALCD